MKGKKEGKKKRAALVEELFTFTMRSLMLWVRQGKKTICSTLEIVLKLLQWRKSEHMLKEREGLDATRVLPPSFRSISPRRDDQVARESEALYLYCLGIEMDLQIDFQCR